MSAALRYVYDTRGAANLAAVPGVRINTSWASSQKAVYISSTFKSSPFNIPFQLTTKAENSIIRRLYDDDDTVQKSDKGKIKQVKAFKLNM